MKRLNQLAHSTFFVALAMLASTAHAMSADSSSYAITLPYVADTASVGTKISIENHSSGGVDLIAWYVGESASPNPAILTCSDKQQTTGTPSFMMNVPPDSVLEIDLATMLTEKCKGANRPAPSADSGTLTFFTRPDKNWTRIAVAGDQPRISAHARVELKAAVGPAPIGFGVAGLPIGAFEGTTQIVSGAKNGAFGSGKFRTDCMIGSMYDAGSSGNLYRVAVKDGSGAMLGSKLLALNPWSAQLLVDVFGLVGVGTSIDNARIEFEPAANKTNPSFMSSCRVIELTRSNVLSNTYLVGKVYEPKDRLRQRTVSTNATPGWGKFTLKPSRTKPNFHVVFLRHPDFVECSVGNTSGQSVLGITVKDPQGNVVAGAPTQSFTGEFYTGDRAAVTGFLGMGAWGIEISANPNSPPTQPVDYTINCVSGNGMSQVDVLFLP